MSKIQITEYNQRDRWSQSVADKLYCSTCYSSKKGAFFEANGENVCISCAVKEIKNSEFHNLVGFTSGTYILDSFLEGGSMTSRLGILLNKEELSSVICGMVENNRENLLRSIGLTLGFISGHPLDLLIRTVSLKLVIALQDLFYETLLVLADNSPGSSEFFDRQKFRYNLTHALAHINENSSFVQDLIFLVLEEASARNDSFVRAWFGFENDKYSPLMSLEYNNAVISRMVETYVIEKSESTDISDYFKPGNIPASIQGKSKDLAGIIDQSYTLNRLKILYSKYLQNLFEKTGEAPPFQWPKKKANKSDYVRLFSHILENSSLTAAFFDELEPWERETLKLIVLEEKNPFLGELETRYNVKIFTGNDRGRFSYYDCDKLISANYPLFFYHLPYEYYSRELNPSVYLPLSLKTVFRGLLPQEDADKLQGGDTFEKGLFHASTVDPVGQISNLAAYIDQVGIKRGKNGRKILKATLKEVSGSCGIDEPYENDKKLSALKATLLIDLLDSKVLEMTDLQLPTEELFREIFSTILFREKGGVFNFFFFLDYLRLTELREYKEDENKRNRCEILAVKMLLNELPSKKWVSVENIIVFLNSKNLLPYPYTLETNINRVEFKTHDDYGYESVIINEYNWSEAVLHPYIKTILFILHAFGAVDLALEYPENKRFQDKANPWLSPYDGIREVSITPLGEWLAGRIENSGGAERKTSSSIIIDDKRLLLTLKGENSLVDITLKRIGESIGNGCYLVTAASFLSSCQTKKDLQDKIKMFRKNISTEPPLNWEQFFSSILRKADPLFFKEVRRFLFRLEPGDKELIRILFDDPIVKKLVMKAEDYHILIKETDYKKVQNRLAQKGFLLPPKDNYEF